MSTPLYRRLFVYYEKDGDADMLALNHKVWDPTPWMIDVNTGSLSTDVGRTRRTSMFEFCTEHFGPESWPIHGKPAAWMFGHATVDGWTWMGFASESLMQRFTSAFLDFVREPEAAAV